MAGIAGEVAAFPCSQCGLCCQAVREAAATRHLDRGDGTCLHYDDATRLCRIYARRPDICRVDRQYTLHYAQHWTWAEFTELNRRACIALQAQPPRSDPTA